MVSVSKPPVILVCCPVEDVSPGGVSNEPSFKIGVGVVEIWGEVVWELCNCASHLELPILVKELLKGVVHMGPAAGVPCNVESPEPLVMQGPS